MESLNRETKKIYLMYSSNETKFSKEFLKKAKDGKFIDDKVK